MTALRHGFGAAANRISLGLRVQLGLSNFDPLDPRVFFDRREIPVFPLSMYRDLCPGSVGHIAPSGDFSAVLLHPEPGSWFVVHNDFHAPGRQASDLSHELAHFLLAHPGEQVCFGDSGRRVNSLVELEAAYLGGCILIPNEAAHRLAALRVNRSDAAEQYGVSEAMVEYRLRVSGAYRRAGASGSAKR